MSRRTRIRARARVDVEKLGDDYRYTNDPALAEERRQRRRERAEAARLEWQKQAVDWTKCIVLGCKFQTLKQISEGIDFPICSVHAAAVWEAIEHRDKIDREEQHLSEAMAAMVARRDAIRLERRQALAEEDAQRKSDLKADKVEGQIYFIMLGDLVKVGWSSNLRKRLKSYGASAELLAHYPAYRADETHLHQQLKPSRAKGREWYHYDSAIRLYIVTAVAKYGPPTVTVDWTLPKEIVAGKHSKGVA